MRLDRESQSLSRRAVATRTPLFQVDNQMQSGLTRVMQAQWLSSVNVSRINKSKIN